MKYILTSIISLLSFVTVSFFVKDGMLSAFDYFFVMQTHPSWLTWAFFIITDMGEWVFITLGTLALFLFFVVKHRYDELIFSAIALFGGLVSQTIAKQLFSIERPLNSLVSTFGDSFPSGHTNMSTILCGLAYIYVFSTFSSLKYRRIALGLSFIFPLLVGVSRVYLNAHWASDVLAGWLLGLFWATVPLAYGYISSARRGVKFEV